MTSTLKTILVILGIGCAATVIYFAAQHSNKLEEDKRIAEQFVRQQNLTKTENDRKDEWKAQISEPCSKYVKARCPRCEIRAFNLQSCQSYSDSPCTILVTKGEAEQPLTLKILEFTLSNGSKEYRAFRARPIDFSSERLSGFKERVVDESKDGLREDFIRELRDETSTENASEDPRW